MTLEGDLQYEDIVTEEPERPFDEDEEYGGGSLSEQEEAGGAVSDFKALLREFRPELSNPRIEKLLNPSRVSRIFPDNFLDKFGVIVAMLVMEQDPDKSFDFIDILNNVQDVLSQGFEGRMLADLLEAYGAVRESELDKLSKDLGI